MGERAGHSGKSLYTKIDVPHMLKHLNPLKNGFYVVKIAIAQTDSTIVETVKIKELESLC